jgi:hypothetical protein
MATSYVSPRIARSKSGADLLFDKMKQEQYKQEEMIAIHYLNQSLELSLESGSLQQELKDGVLLCK